MSDDEFAVEPVPGLPELLPEGERMLWQGKPDWIGLAKRGLYLKPVIAYCTILLGWFAVSGLSDGMGGLAVAQSLLLPLLLAVALVAIIFGLAFFLARSTIYTITNRRVVMRFGIALPITINLPFSRIETAALRKFGDGAGDIPLTIKGKDKLAWLHLWPHARPWRLTKPEPMLRSVPEAEKIASILAEAMASALPEGQMTLPLAAKRTVNAAADHGLATA
ncbi:MAG: photosynthetic complex putative assembly protein PuhB [Pseudomonadota bacterium]